MTTESAAPVVDPRYVIDRQGKSFVLFIGLLDLGHRQGLKRVETQLLQIGSDDNGQCWLVRAEVETERGVFSGLGDASPANVSRAMLTVLPRFAETRAVARALRFATNVGIAAIEELGDDDDQPREPRPAPRPTQSEPVAAQTKEQPRRVDATVTPSGVTANGPSRPAPERAPSANVNPSGTAHLTATPAQVRVCFSIGRDQHALSEQDVDERSRTLFGAPVAELSRRQASEFITSLKGSR